MPTHEAPCSARDCKRNFGISGLKATCCSRAGAMSVLEFFRPQLVYRASRLRKSLAPNVPSVCDVISCFYMLLCLGRCMLGRRYAIQRSAHIVTNDQFRDHLGNASTLGKLSIVVHLCCSRCRKPCVLFLLLLCLEIYARYYY